MLSIIHRPYYVSVMSIMITNKMWIKFATIYDRPDIRHLFKSSNVYLSGVDGVTRKFFNPFISVSNTRPLSAPFLFRTSGKGTDMATPLGPEKYGRIDFSLGRWTTMGQNAPKLELKHAKEQVELVRIFLRSLLRPQESLFWRSSFICCKKY